MAPETLQRLAGEGIRRLTLLLIAVVVLAVVFQLVCAAAVLALRIVLPVWAAVAITAVAALIVAAVLLLLALRRPAVASRSAGSPGEANETALALGEMAGRATRRRPKTTLAVAAALGVVLGADPGLRRDLLDLLGSGPE